MVFNIGVVLGVSYGGFKFFMIVVNVVISVMLLYKWLVSVIRIRIIVGIFMIVIYVVFLIF